MVVARRVEGANVSDRRVGARLLAGLQSGFPSIRTVMADAGCKLNRRLSKDYELKVQTSEAFIDLAAIRLMLKRLAPR